MGFGCRSICEAVATCVRPRLRGTRYKRVDGWAVLRVPALMRTPRPPQSGSTHSLPSEPFHPGAQLHLPRPGAARLLQHMQIALRDGVGVEIAVGGHIAALDAALLGVAHAAVDDKVRDMDALGRQLPGHGL